MSGKNLKEFAATLTTSTNATFKKNNPQLFGAGGPDAQQRSVKSPDQRGAGQAVTTGGKSTASTFKTPEDKLNKLERRWLAVLRTRYPNPGIQNITLRLSDDLRYTPDLNSNQVPLVFYETKGPHRFREKGILKTKWAAKLYPFFDFYLVTWDKDKGWTEEFIAKE